MKQKLNTLMMKMQVFFNAWDQMEDLNKYNEYDIARKMINVIQKETNKTKSKAPTLKLLKGDSDEGPKAS